MWEREKGKKPESSPEGKGKNLSILLYNKQKGGRMVGSFWIGLES